jgi:tetratricopeptide (TPR) repeat protein
MTKLFLPLATLVPILSFGQKITEADVQKVMLLSEQGKTNLALVTIDSLRKATKVKDENYSMLIMTSAELNMKAFNCEAAIRDNEELIKLLPDNEIDCQTHIAEFKKYIGDFEGALAAYKRILQINSSEEILYNNMASAYNSAGKYQDAIKILKVNPNTKISSLEYYNYAIAYFNLNKLDSAKQAMDKYLSTEDAENDFEAYKYAAQIYSALNDKKKSCELITKATNILTTNGTEEQINKQPQKIKDYYFIKNALKEIDETKKLKAQFCD